MKESVGPPLNPRLLLCHAMKYVQPRDVVTMGPTRDQQALNTNVPLSFSALAKPVRSEEQVYAYLWGERTGTYSIPLPGGGPQTYPQGTT
jgi:hypothetical protein